MLIDRTEFQRVEFDWLRGSPGNHRPFMKIDEWLSIFRNKGVRNFVVKTCIKWRTEVD